ncbi:MAG: NifU family protein [Bacillota bacterium]|nr:NifU family protein [Bacillota bacterium]
MQDRAAQEKAEQQGPEQGRVEAVLNRVRPMLQADGGDVELVGIAGGVVKVRLKGTCGGCPFAAMTIKNGIEAALKAEIPEVKAVQAV